MPPKLESLFSPHCHSGRPISAKPPERGNQPHSPFDFFGVSRYNRGMTDALPTSSSVLPSQGSFSGHETFALRYAWLKKGIDGLERSRDIFSREDALVELGVGKNMVRSIRHWCLATGVIEEADAAPGSRARPLRPSAFGSCLLLGGWDPYLEDDASLWLLHWHLATNATRATTWHWVFNHVAEPEFTRDGLLLGLTRYAENNRWNRVSQASLKSDVSCFLRSYVPGKRGPATTAEETLDCPLTTLGLIREAGEEHHYRFQNGVKSGLPDAVFAYAMLSSWNKHHGGQETLSLREITHGENSPGRIFRLDEDAVLAYLDRISGISDQRLEFNDSVMVRQVVRKSPIDGMEILNDYYRS